MKKHSQYVAKIAEINHEKLNKLDIIYTSMMIGGAKHVMMTERDWKWALRAGAATIHKQTNQIK